MKKGDVIKRRKRVMPATATSSPQTHHQAHAHPDSSVSPDPAYPHEPSSSIAALPATAAALPVHTRDPARVLEPAFPNNGPPPVDFTPYARKRAFGDSDAASALSGAVSGVLGGGGEPIDPGLGIAAAEAAESKEQVRARLQRERQAMREKLRAVESELARMEQDG